MASPSKADRELMGERNGREAFRRQSAIAQRLPQGRISLTGAVAASIPACLRAAASSPAEKAPAGPSALEDSSVRVRASAVPRGKDAPFYVSQGWLTLPTPPPHRTCNKLRNAPSQTPLPTGLLLITSISPPNPRMPNCFKATLGVSKLSARMACEPGFLHAIVCRFAPRLNR
jgi:hypothetical protein